MAPLSWKGCPVLRLGGANEQQVRDGTMSVQPAGSEGRSHVPGQFFASVGGHWAFSFEGPSCTLEKRPCPCWGTKTKGALLWGGRGRPGRPGLPVRARRGLGRRGCPAAPRRAAAVPGGTRTRSRVPSAIPGDHAYKEAYFTASLSV